MSEKPTGSTKDGSTADDDSVVDKLTSLLSGLNTNSNAQKPDNGTATKGADASQPAGDGVGDGDSKPEAAAQPPAEAPTTPTSPPTAEALAATAISATPAVEIDRPLTAQERIRNFTKKLQRRAKAVKNLVFDVSKIYAERALRWIVMGGAVAGLLAIYFGATGQIDNSFASFLKSTEHNIAPGIAGVAGLDIGLSLLNALRSRRKNKQVNNPTSSGGSAHHGH